MLLRGSVRLNRRSQLFPSTTWSVWSIGWQVIRWQQRRQHIEPQMMDVNFPFPTYSLSVRNRRKNQRKKLYMKISLLFLILYHHSIINHLRSFWWPLASLLGSIATDSDTLEQRLHLCWSNGFWVANQRPYVPPDCTQRWRAPQTMLSKNLANLRQPPVPSMFSPPKVHFYLSKEKKKVSDEVRAFTKMTDASQENVRPQGFWIHLFFQVYNSYCHFHLAVLEHNLLVSQQIKMASCIAIMTLLWNFYGIFSSYGARFYNALYAAAAYPWAVKY